MLMHLTYCYESTGIRNKTVQPKAPEPGGYRCGHEQSRALPVIEPARRGGEHLPGHPGRGS